MITVNGCGRTPNSVMLVGEAPGREEAARGKPFVGKSGQEQEWYLQRRGLTAVLWYRTNVVKEYRDGNPDPTPAQVKHWTPVLINEVRKVQPLLIVAVGRFATRWFLGDSVDMETVHGLPHHAGAFDPSRKDRAMGAVVLPVYHPAAGFYDNDVKALIDWDYEQIALTIDAQDRQALEFPARDEHEGHYADVGGGWLADYLSVTQAEVVGIDTEGSTSDPWSVQVSIAAGSGYTLRYERDDFAEGIDAIQQLVDGGAVAVMHNAMFDIEMCRVMGLELRDAKCWDSMYAAYLLRLEPQGLKPLAYRWTGMVMQSYSEVVGDVGIDLQMDYLGDLLELEPWPKADPYIEYSNDGTARLKTVQPVERRAESILVDYYSEKLDKDGNRTDPLDRWKKVHPALRDMVEEKLGPMPEGSLADIPRDVAVRYASRDADAALRVYERLLPELEARGFDDLMSNGSEVLPIFEEMQHNGMPASRAYFEQLADTMQDAMWRIGSRISHRYYSSKPFNPKSPLQVASLLRRRGLQPAKRTATGSMSTGKDSIEHLRYTDPAISDVFEWREHQHIRDSFCKPVLTRIPVGEDIHPVRCQIKMTRTATRRLAAADPNLLNIPARSELGLKVREGYVCPDGEVFGAWDLSQIEVRVAAHESRDKLLCRMLRDGVDIHTETATRMFEVDAADVTKDQRVAAKTGTFGILYGMSPHTYMILLQKQGLTGWTDARCKDGIEKWFTTYSGVAEYVSENTAQARREGLVTDCWGMVRYLPGIWSDDNSVRAEAERIATNHKIQGGAQGMIQRSMVWLDRHVRDLQRAGENVQWCLQVHDEVILKFDEDLWPVMNGLVLEALTEHSGIELRVPVEAEGHMAKTWGGLK